MKFRSLMAVLLAALAGTILSQVALAGDSGLAPQAATAAEIVAPPVVAPPELGPKAKPRPRGHLVARLIRATALRSRPGGRVLARLGATTEFGQPRRLGVVKSRGRWLAVTTAALPNGKVGWVKRGRGIRLRRVRISLHADVSERTVELRRGRRVLKRLSVAVGRPGSPTPRGRFAVTDKLRGGSFGPYYGCCVLALSATQPNTPPGWQGGNRMAIHGTSAPGTIGQAASAGCLRAADGDLEVLMRRVPAGAPVFVRG